MLQHNLVIAFRNLLKNRVQVFICTVCLAVGLVCFGLCTYLVRYWLDEDKGFANKERIAEIALISEKGRLQSGTPTLLAKEIEGKQLSSIERMTRAAYCEQENLTFEITENKALPYRIRVMETDTNFIPVFSIKLLAGDLPTINKQPDLLLLSQFAAHKIYGTDVNPIGRQVTSEKQKVYTIGGVFEDLPANNSISRYQSIEALKLSVLDGFLAKEYTQTTGCLTFALLAPGQKAGDLDNLFRKQAYRHLLYEKDPTPVRAFPLGDKKYMETGMNFFFGFIFFIGLLILLTALLNYFSFFSGSFINRIKEFCVRKELGGNRIHLFLLLYSELVISLLLTGILALCLTELFASGLQFSFFRIHIEFNSMELSRQIGEYIGICFVITAFICWIICYRINRHSLMDGIRFSRHRVRNVLLGVQFFIALLFFSGAVVCTLQTREGEQSLFNSLDKKEKERILFVRTDYKELKTNHGALLSEWKSNSLVEDILQVENTLSSTRINSYVWADGEGSTAGGFIRASANITSFLKLKPVTGTFKLDEQSLLVNEYFMKVLNGNPINRLVRINNDEREYQIIGVTSPLMRFVDGSSYFSALAIGLVQGPANCYVRVQEGKEKEGRQFLTETIRTFLPESIEPEIRSLKEECERTQMMERTMGGIFSFFALVSLIITLLGIYAAISQDTLQRQKEMAIRKINGASLRHILAIFARLYLKLLLIATCFVFPIMWIATASFLKSWIIQFNYRNPFVWIGIFAFITFIIGLTIISKIIKTARINPAEIIKAE